MKQETRVSERRKVELLEQAVLERDVRGVEDVFQRFPQIEFTARALGLACRFCGEEMVRTLLARGASFLYACTPVLVNKYKCKKVYSNTYSAQVDYMPYLFPAYQVEGYDMPPISDEERKAVVTALLECGAGAVHEKELLYRSILLHDEPVYRLLRDRGICRLSDARERLVSGADGFRTMDARGIYTRGEFDAALGRADPEGQREILANFLEVMDRKMLHLSPFFYTGEELKAVCTPVLFDFMALHTDLLDMAKTAEMVEHLCRVEYYDGIRHILDHRRVNVGMMLENAVARGDLTLIRILMDSGKLTPFSLGKGIAAGGNRGEICQMLSDYREQHFAGWEPTPVRGGRETETQRLKGLWNYSRLADGTLMLTGYKGEEACVTVPAVIGKTPVSGIGRRAFSPDKKRYDNSEFKGSVLKQVVIPEGITRVEREAFKNCRALERVELPRGLRVIGAWAFSGCTALRSIRIPEGVRTLEFDTFFGCKNLSQVILPASVEEIGEYMFSLDIRTIRAPAGSYAQEYADGNDIPFEAI